MAKPLRRIFWYVLVAAVVAGGLVYAFLPRPVAVDLAVIQRGELVVTIDGDGQTRVREVYTVSAPVAGRVLRIERHVGDDVIANRTLLAAIEPGDPTFLDRRARAQAEAAVKAAQAAFALAEAEQARALAELDFARAELSRAEQLAARDNISQRDLDRARLEVRTRLAARDTAIATVEMRQFELETARAALIQPGEGGGNDAPACCIEVYSPVDGKILRVIQESEGVVPAGSSLVELGDPGDLEVVVDLLSGDAVRVRPGAEVTLENWGGGITLSGRVRHVEPYAFTKVSALGIEEQRVNVLIDFADPPEQWQGLGHGYRVNARILDWRGADVLRLPLGALFRDGEYWAVFAAVDGVARLRHVDIDHSNGREAEITGGLEEGDTVILHPSDLVADGVGILARAE